MGGLTLKSLDPNAPDWLAYSTSTTNYKFNATDDAPVLGNEADTYRVEGIGIWNSHVLEAYYNEEAPVGSSGSKIG